MDLQWQRQTELWLRLMDFPHETVAPILTLNQGLDTWYLEQRGERARLTLARKLPEIQLHNALLRLLGLLQPEAGNGIPLRAWLTRDSLWLSAMAPPQSGAELWFSLSRRQRYLFDRITVNSNENNQ